MLRVAYAVRAFSFRAGQPFHARFLLQNAAESAFKSPVESVRHLFAKDVLELLKTGDCADRLYACQALQMVKSSSGLGRFHDDMVYNLMKVAKNRVAVNHPVHPEVREEAIEALKRILPAVPAVAAARYPYLKYHLERLQLSAPDEALRSKVTTLLAQLNADVISL